MNIKNDLSGTYVLGANLSLPSDFEPIGSSGTGNHFTGKFDGNGYTITLNMDRSAAAHMYTGLFGYTNNAKIENLNVEGTVISTSTGGYNAYAGGIVGYADQTEIKNCHFSGKVEATGGNYAFAGGIVGNATSNSKIVGCSNTGSVKATSSTNSACAGGIAGQATNTEINECSNTGSVTTTSSNGNVSAGGIVGYAGGRINITVCFNSGTVKAASTAEGKLTRAGGIVGGGDGTSTTPVKITNCYNTGSVSATGKDDVRAGGTVGRIQFVIITDCYNVARVTATSSKVNAYAAGGIVGLASDAEINYCFFLKGTVSGDKIAGSATDTNYDGSKSEPEFSGAYTAANMKTSAMYESWNFTAVWDINDNVNNGFPTLKSNPHADPQVVPPSGGGGVDIVLIAAIAIVAIGAIGAAVWFFFLRI